MINTPSLKSFKIKLIPSIILVVFISAIAFAAYMFLRPRSSFAPNTKIVKATGAYAYKNTSDGFKTQFKSVPTTTDSVVFANKVGKISFFTPSNQSFGNISSSTPAVASGSTITYPDIYQSLDLRYTISSARLLEEFIIKDAATAAQIDKIAQIANTKNTYEKDDGGSIIFKNKDKVVFTLPHPVMYEEGNKEIFSYEINYDIVKDKDSLIITKVISDGGKAWLADENRKYPVVIDLVIDNAENISSNTFSIDNADTAANWTSSDATSTPVSSEGIIKQEGTASTKIQTAADVSATNILDLMEYSSDANARAAYVAVNTNTLVASGGTITTSGANKIHTFTTSGTFTESLGSGNVAVLVVGGGGGGGGSNWGGGGGGGAGGFVYNAAFATTPQAYAVTVGNLGAGGAATPVNGTNGGNSIFNSITSVGGGGGGRSCNGCGSAGSAGGSGGGGGYLNGALGAGTGGQGNNGAADPANNGGGGGGSTSAGSGINGGNGTASSISGSSISYSGGGGGSTGTNGTGSTGYGSGGKGGYASVGVSGQPGVVIISYPAMDLQSYSEPTIKTEGTYALKGYAEVTTAANKTLTRTIVSPLNLSNRTNVTFDIRSTRTGSNIKVGLHDVGGITTEITPNITGANAFQSVTLDLSAVTNANKDAIDQIIITILNADAANTFYIDNMVANTPTSINDTITRTSTVKDLSTSANLTYWVRSSVTGTFATIGFGEAAATEQTQSITINSANTWEQKSWDLTGITGTSRDAVTKFAFKFTSDTSGASFYFDDIQTNALFAPSLGTPVPLSSTSIRWVFTDNSAEEIGFKIYDSNSNLLVTCPTTNLGYCDETGLTPDTQYTRKIGTYNASSTSISSGTTATYTLAVAPNAPVVNTRTSTTVLVNPDPGTNPAGTLMAIYKATGTTCDGTGGAYIAANGTGNGATAVWQSDATWGTVSISGLTTETQFIFCVKAKNGNNLETSFSPVGADNGGYVPISGSFINSANTTAINKYIDGNSPARYVIGIDAGSGVTNTANFELKSGIFTLNSNETLVTGSMTLTGGSLAIATGGVIKLNTPVWAIDADADGYTSDNKLYFGSAPVNGRRKYLLTTLTQADCSESLYNTANSCCTIATRYADTDGDGYGAGAGVSICPTGGYVDNNTDCGPSTATAYPGSATCSTGTFLNASGVASYDWNCNAAGGAGATCGTILNNVNTGIWATTGEYQCNMFSCDNYANFVKITISGVAPCGQTGYYCSYPSSQGHCKIPENYECNERGWYLTVYEYACRAVATSTQACN